MCTPLQQKIQNHVTAQLMNTEFSVIKLLFFTTIAEDCASQTALPRNTEIQQTATD